MPFALALIGIALIVTAIRGTSGALGAQLAADVTGGGQGFRGSFLAWLAAIVAVGALGYAPAMRTPSRLLLALIILGMLIANQGVFAQFKAAVTSEPAPAPVPADTTTAALPAAFPVQFTGAPGASGGGSAGQTAGSVIGGIAKAIPFIGGLF